MATVVTEVASTSSELEKTLRKVIGWFCDSQIAFRLELLALPKASRRELSERAENSESVRATDVFETLRSAARELKGMHDRIILFIEDQLDGEELANLFASVDQAEDESFTGLAVVSTWDFDELSEGLPIEGYLLQQLVSINIRWVVGRSMLHTEGPDDCLFHKRIEKRRIALSVKEMRLCDTCRVAAQQLDDNQWQSLKDLMHDVSKAVGKEDPRAAIDELIASRRISKLKENLEFGVDLWRRLRAGRARFTIAGLLVVGGLDLMSPTWWQWLLAELFGWVRDSDPSTLQQVFGFFVVGFGFYLLAFKQPPTGGGNPTAVD